VDFYETTYASLFGIDITSCSTILRSSVHIAAVVANVLKVLLLWTRCKNRVHNAITYMRRCDTR